MQERERERDREDVSERESLKENVSERDREDVSDILTSFLSLSLEEKEKETERTLIERNPPPRGGFLV